MPKLNTAAYKSQKAKLLLDAGILAYFLGDFPACEAKLQESAIFWEENRRQAVSGFGFEHPG